MVEWWLTVCRFGNAHLSVPELVLLLNVFSFHGLSDHALSVLRHSLLLEVLQQL